MGYVLSEKQNQQIDWRKKRTVEVQLKATYKWEKCNSYVIWKTDSSAEVNDYFNGENLFLCKYNIHPEVWWDI